MPKSLYEGNKNSIYKWRAEHAEEYKDSYIKSCSKYYANNKEKVRQSQTKNRIYQREAARFRNILIGPF